jgi:hypothetical protein
MKRNPQVIAFMTPFPHSIGLDERSHGLAR